MDKCQIPNCGSPSVKFFLLQQDLDVLCLRCYKHYKKGILEGISIGDVVEITEDEAIVIFVMST